MNIIPRTLLFLISLTIFFSTRSSAQYYNNTYYNDMFQWNDDFYTSTNTPVSPDFSNGNTLNTNFTTYPDNKNLGYSAVQNNWGGLIEDNEYLMSSYLYMFMASEKLGTPDYSYLQLFLKHAENVLNRRDDNTVSTISNNPVWVNRHGDNYNTPKKEYPFLYHTAKIIYPLAYFSEIVKHGSEYTTPQSLLTLQSQTMGSYNPTVISGADPLRTPFNFSNKSFLWIVDNVLIPQILNSINYHHGNHIFNGVSYGGEWVTSLHNGVDIGRYKYLWDVAGDISVAYNNGDWLPLNMTASMGRVMLMMYKATGDAFYLDKTIKIGNNVKQNMLKVTSTSGYSDKLVWKYDDQINNPYPGTSSSKYEDLSHAVVTADFAYLCYKNNIKISTSSSQNIFGLTDMQKVAKTFKDMYRYPQTFYNCINATNCGEPNNNYYYHTSLWQKYSEFDGDIYHIVAANYDSSLTCTSLSEIPNSSIGMLGIASSAYLQKNLNVVSIKAHGIASNWQATDVGDLNNDGIKEIVSVRDFDGDIYVHTYNSVTKKMTGAGLIDKEDVSEWRGLALGNFDGIPGDEIAVLRNYDNVVYIYKYATYVNGIFSFTNIGSKYLGVGGWAGLAAGDFDAADTKEELVALSYNSGTIYHIDFSGTNPLIMNVSATYNTGAIGYQKWAGIASGYFTTTAGNKKGFAIANSDNGNIYSFVLNSSNTIVQTASLILNNAINWRGITAGDYDGNGFSEICVNTKQEGDLYFYKVNGANIQYFNREYFPINLNNNILGSGNLTDGGCYCENKDEIINYRNQDGWCFVYETKFGPCTKYVPGLACKTDGNLINENNNQATSFEDIKSDSYNFELYPNPITNNATFLLSSSEITSAYLKIYNINGVEMMSFDLDADIFNKKTNLSLDNLSNGFYFYTVSFEKSSILLSGKFIVQKQ